MRDDYNRDQERSERAFREIVWPCIGPRLGGGELFILERKSDPLSMAMDRIAGIDSLQVIDIVGIRGISSRVQWVNKAWPTLTVRHSRVVTNKETEFSKRCRQIKGGYLYPHLMVHAYLSKTDEKLLFVAVAKTVDIIKTIEDGRKGNGLYDSNGITADWYMQENGHDGNQFCCVSCESLKNRGLEVFVYPPQPTASNVCGQLVGGSAHDTDCNVHQSTMFDDMYVAAPIRQGTNATRPGCSPG